MFFLKFETPSLSARELNDAIEESDESDVPLVYYNENLNYIGHCVTEVCLHPIDKFCNIICFH